MFPERWWKQPVVVPKLLSNTQKLFCLRTFGNTSIQIYLTICCSNLHAGAKSLVRSHKVKSGMWLRLQFSGWRQFVWPQTLHLQHSWDRLCSTTPGQTAGSLVSYWLGCVYWHFRWFDDMPPCTVGLHVWRGLASTRNFHIRQLRHFFRRDEVALRKRPGWCHRKALWCVFIKLLINKASVGEENSRTDALLPFHLYVLTLGKIIKSAVPLAGEQQLGGWNDFFLLLNTWINQHTLNINMNLIPPFIFFTCSLALHTLYNKRILI